MDGVATFSNHRAPVDIAAPGVCVLSTVPAFLLPDDCPTRECYAVDSGTSYSAALLMSRPFLRPFEMTPTPAQVRSRLLATAEPGPIPASSYDWRFVPQAGKTFSDSGHGSCHGRPTP